MLCQAGLTFWTEKRTPNIACLNLHWKGPGKEQKSTTELANYVIITSTKRWYYPHFQGSIEHIWGEGEPWMGPCWYTVMAEHSAMHPRTCHEAHAGQTLVTDTVLRDLPRISVFRGDQKTLNKSRHWEESIRRGHDTDHKSASGMRLRGACALTHLNGLLWKNKSFLQNLFCPVSGPPGWRGPFFFFFFFFFPVFHFAALVSRGLANTLASLPPIFRQSCVVLTALTGMAAT